MEELILRIENLLSMNIDTHKSIDFKRIKLGSYEFDYERFQLFRENERINLSHRENELILLLSQHVNKKLDRREILNKLWGDDSIYNSRNLDVYMRKLRVYFEKDPQIKIITLRGIGYHFSIS